jgi:hypothetical protein
MFGFYAKIKYFSDMNQKEQKIHVQAPNIYEQRFELLLKLIKIDQMLKKAVITPAIPTKEK